MINKQSIYSKTIKEAGFLKLSDIRSNGFKLKRWDAFGEKNLSLSYYLLLQGIFSAIPPNWKLPFKDEENTNIQTDETVSDYDVQDITRMTSKSIYSTLVKRIQIPLTGQSKFNSFYYIDTSVLLENIPLVKFIKTTSGTLVDRFIFHNLTREFIDDFIDIKFVS